jgi:hypothetical protein
MKKAILVASAAAVLSSACTSSGGGPLGFVMFDKNQHVPGVGPLFAAGEDRCITGTFLLSVLGTEAAPLDETAPCRAVRQRIRGAVAGTSIYGTNANYSKRQRNEIVDTFVWESNDQCFGYVKFLQGYQGNVRSSSGIFAQATAILATVTSGGTAQGFAAASGIVGGAGNALYQAHFADQTVAVIVQAFDNVRSRRLQELTNLQQCEPDQYTLTRAMADVTRYHASCSLAVGLAETQRAVGQTDTVSIATFNALLDQITEAQEKIARFRTANPTAPAQSTPSAGQPSQQATHTGPVAGSSGSDAGNAAIPLPVATAGLNQSSAPAAPACPFNSAQPSAVKPGR